MRALVKEILQFLKSYAPLNLILSTGGLLIALLIFNYTLDFEDNYIDYYTGSWLKWVWMYLYEGVPYLLSCLLLWMHGIKTRWFKNKGFWIHFLLGFSILAFDRSWHLWLMLKTYMDPIDAVYLYKVISSGKSLLSTVLPLCLLYLLLENRSEREFYGFNFRRFNPKPYFIILGIALIFIFIGGFFGDIQEYYPRYLKTKGFLFAMNHKIPEWVAVLGFEFMYGVDFISTEMFFRGFLMFAMYRYLGPYAIYPMVVSYCVLHFGKPLTESISSIFGGYILGIISLHHRNIWGGVIIHVGVAWGMEIIGYLHRL